LSRIFKIVGFLFFSGIFCTDVFSQAEDPIKVGVLKAEYKKNRSILKISCELKFSPPWHINSDSLQQDYLIETRIIIADTSKGYPVKRTFPKPSTITLFGEKMEVFDKDVSFKQYFYLNPKTIFPIKFKLQYQSCSDKICLPPRFHELTIKKRSENKYTAHI